MRGAVIVRLTRLGQPQGQGIKRKQHVRVIVKHVPSQHRIAVRRGIMAAAAMVHRGVFLVRHMVMRPQTVMQVPPVLPVAISVRGGHGTFQMI